MFVGARVFALLFLAVFAFVAPTYGAQYSYDSSGRLVQVVEADGSSIQYTYDANGNMTSITRTGGAAAIGINSFSPASGAVGSTVTIHGYGFSSTGSLNTVKFNGVAATVISASGSTLTVSVPSGATTGPLSVTSTAGSATSSDSFTVTTVAVTSFTPTVAAAGTVVTINGSGFDPTAANDAISFNTTTVVATSATATQIQATVPVGATSGHITVSTPTGTATSAGVLVTPPAGIPASSITMTGVLTPGGSGLVYDLPIANKAGAAFFDGAAGQHVTLVMTNVTVGGYLKIYAPDGSLFYSGGPSNSTALDLPALTLTGTYSIYLQPTNLTGAITLRVATDALGTIATNGDPLSLSLQAGQNGSFTFPVTANTTYNLALTPFASNPSGGSVRAKILKSDGTVLKDCGSYSAGSPGCRFVASATDTYTLRLDPLNLYATTFVARINQDITGVLTAGGSPFNLNLAKPGANATLTFSATAGQTVALNFGSVAISPAGGTVNFTILKSSGTQILNQGFTGARTFNLYNLDADTYTVVIVPYNSATATVNVTLAQQMGGVVPVDGTTASYTAAVPGQYAYFTFSGTAGQTISIALRSITFSPSSSSYLSGTVYKPDGSVLYPYNNSPITCYSSSTPGCSVSYRNLPATGTYRLVVTPPTDINPLMSFALTISSAATGTLTAGGSPINLNLASPGQNAWLSFTATAGQTVALNVNSVVTVPASKQLSVLVFDSAGTQVGSTAGNSTMTANIVNLAAGTYFVLIDGSSAFTTTASVQLASLLGGTAPVDGTTSTYAAAVPGQNAYFTFSGTAGQTVSFAITGATFTPTSTGHLTANAYSPSGASLDSGNPLVCYSSSTPGCARSLFNLPATGTYKIIVSPPDVRTAMSFGMTVSPATAGTLSLGGSAQNVSLAYPGQSAVLTFTTTSVQTVVVSASSIVSIPAGKQLYMWVYNSAGTYVAGTSSTSSSMTLTLSNLAVGTYSVMIGSSDAETATMSVSAH